MTFVCVNQSRARVLKQTQNTREIILVTQIAWYRFICSGRQNTKLGTP